MNYLYKNRKNYASDLESTTSRKFSNLFKTIAVLAVLFVFGNAKAATITSTVTGGNWNATTTWVGGVIPTATDDVVLGTNATITVTADASCATLTFGTVAQTTTLNINTGITLNVSGLITIPRAATSGMNSIAVGAGTLNAGSISFTAGGGTSRHKITISTGTLNVSGDITQTSSTGSATIAFSGAGLLKIGGAFWTSGTGTLTQFAGSTVEYYASANQTIQTFAYNNLVLSGSGTKTFAAATTISGNLSIASGVVANLGTFFSTSATLNLGGTNQTAGGATYGGTGTTGTTINTTYFAAGSGKITVGTGCSTGTWVGTTSTDWNTASNWCNAAIPTAITNVTIPSGGNQPTITGSAACLGITINTGATLTVSATGTLAVSGAITKTGALTLNTGSTVNYALAGAQTVLDVAYSNLTLSGSGIKTQTLGTSRTISGNLVIGSGATYTIGGTSTTRTFTVTGTTDVTGTFNLGTATAAKTFTGDVTLNSGGIWTEGGAAAYNFAGNLVNNATTFTASTGTHTFSGATKTLSGATVTSIPTVAITGSYTNSGTLTISTALSGAGSLTQDTNSTLNIGGTAGITTLTANAVGNTVNYTGGAQTAFVTTYHNLTLSGTATKTFATTPTVNGVLSMEGTTAAMGVTTGVVTYGANATLQYNKTANYTATTKEWISPFVATGGIIIKNTGVITTPGAVQIGSNTNVPLNINSGATLTPGANLITLHGDFIKAGTLNSGTGGITIAGTVTTQSIAGFTTTGTVSMTKTSGAATITGAISGGALAINGTGGTLNLGTSFTHAFSGNATFTSGTLNGGNSNTITFSGNVTLTGGTFNGGSITTINANSSSTTAWVGTGTVFVPGTSTVVFGGTNQTIGATAPSFYNVSFSGTTATKTITNALTVTNNINIISSAKLLLTTGTTSTTKVLQFGGASQAGGSWGFTGSGATHLDTTYFATGGTGIINSSTVQRYVITGTGTQNAGTSQSITITIENADGSTVSYTGDKTLTFSGALSSPNATTPTIVNKSGTAIAFGSATIITFTSGVATITNGMTLYNAEIANISTTDGTLSSTGSDRLTVTVSPASSSLVFTTQPNGGNTNAVWTSQPVITWQDTYGNLNTGTANSISLAIGTNPSSGTLTGTTTLPLNIVTAQATFSGLSIDKAGTRYTLSVTGTSGSGIASTTFNITNLVPTLASISPNTVCSGGADFTLTVHGSNFNAGSVININNSPRTTSFIDGTTLSAVILASDIASNATPSITVVTPTPGGGTSSGIALTVIKVVINPTITQPNCFSDGSISLAPSGGTSPYTIDWADITGTSNPKDRTGLLPGTYTVTVTDANNCATTSGTYTIIAATGCSGITVCKSDTASILSVPPNPEDTSYTWTLPSGAVINSGQGTSSLSINWTGVAVGGYVVTVVGNNSCATSSPTGINVYVQEPSVTASADLACSGSNLNLYASGGVSYSWTGPNSFRSQSANPVIYNATATQNGTYTVVITNAAGCAKSTTVSVTVNTPPTVSGAITQSTSGNTDGSIVLTVSGGTSYTYLWTAQNSNFTSTSQNISAIPSDNYTVVVTNQTGCSTTKTFAVNNSDGPVTVATPTNVTCNGSDNGSISLATTAISSDTFSYSWTGPGSYTSVNQDITNLAPGTYTVVTTDNVTGNTGVASATITQPLALQADGVATNVSCYGATSGAISLTVSGGTSSYTYAWSNSATTKDISGLVAGDYSVTVTDANNCTFSKSFTITQPAAAISASSTITNVSCYGGSNGQVVLAVSGGTAPYTYAWTGPSSFTATTKDISGQIAGTYSVTITDAKSCTLSLTSGTAIVIAQPAAALSLSTSSTNVNCRGNATGAINLTTSGGTSPYLYSWSNGLTTEDLSNLAIGTYSVIVTDAKSCTATTSVTITQPAANLSATNTKTDVVCNGGATGAINLTVTGGTYPYTYLWSNSATTEDLSALTAGTYSVVITDANGCTTTNSATIAQPAAITVAGSVTNVLCNGGATGAITISASGGTGSYSYNWGGGITSKDRTDLAAGTYTVTVTDASSCTTAATSFVITQSPALALTTVKKNIGCKSVSNGSIALSVTGGVYPYSYSWTGTNNFTATTQNIDAIPAGTYSVTVTDSNSCTASETGIILTEPSSALSINTTSTDVTCLGGSNGSISAIASGGSGSYTYSWSTGATTDSVTNLIKGTYSVLVTDSNGCTLSKNVNVTEPTTKMELYANVTKSSSCGTATGTIEVTVVNGNAPYSYVWDDNNSQTTANRTNLAAGNYTVTVTDHTGCSNSLIVTVDTAGTLSTSITTYNKTCLYNDGSAYVNVVGGVAPYTYYWSNGATTPNIALLSAGAVSVTVTDANGCQVIQTATVGSNSCLAPIAVNDTFTTSYNTSVSGTVATGDYDPDPLDPDHPFLQFFSTQNPTTSQGVLTWGTDYDGTFTFVPAVGFSGTITLPYKVFDITGLSTTGTYTITVGPSAVNDALGTPLNTDLTSNVNTNDFFATESVFSKLSDPTHGTITFNTDGSFVYTPTTNYAGDDSFTYKICLASPNQTNCSTTATVLISINGSADVAIAQTVNNATPNVGANVEFTITATNNGPNLALGINVTDNLPSGYTYVSSSTATGSFDATTGIWAVGSLANTATATLTITATVNPTGNFINSASITTTSTEPIGAPNNNTATASTTPVLQSDVSILESIDNASQNIGSDVIFTLTVTNNGPNNATGISVADLLPSGFTYISSNPGTGTYTNSSGVWAIGNLTNGSSVTLTISATVNNSGILTNTAVVSSTTHDPSSSNNSASQIVTPGAISNLSLTKTLNNANPYVGGLVEFTLTATNNGPNGATNVYVIDQLPTGYTYDSDNGSGVFNATSGVWTIGSLANGASRLLKVYAIVKASGDYTNSATVSSADQPDSDTSNNSASVAPTTVVGQADLSITKTVNSTEAVIGNNVVFTISVTNNGPSDATGVNVSDLLPSGYNYVSNNTVSGTFTNSSGLWNIGTIANGATKTITITATVKSTGNYLSSASVTATTTDLTSGNNTASKTVTPIPLLVITNPAAVCSPATVDITASAITSGSSSDLTYTYWNDSNATSPYSTPLEATNGTYYIKAATSGGNFTVEPVFVIVNSTSVAGSISGNGSVCKGTNSTTLTLTGNTGSIQWQSSTNNSSFADINGATASTYIVTNLNASTYYRAIVTNGACSSATTSSVQVEVISSNIWNGSISTAWNTAANWNCGVPSSGDNIEIPSGLTHYPVLSESITIGNVIVGSGATVNLNGSTLSVSGIFSGTGTLIGGDSSSLTINGSGNQGTFYLNQATPGTTNTVANFVINSSSTGSATLGNAMGISGMLTLTKGTFNTGGNLTLMSNSAKTAVVAPITDCNAVAINGDVTVEQYFPARRAFRFISSPVTTTSSIRDNWQEGVNNAPPAYSTNSNPHPGYGTHITGTISGNYGFDATQTTNNSMFTFNNTTGAWAAVPNTNSLTLTAGVPYRLMIRGDRSIDMSTNTPTPTNTTLRAKGALKICDTASNTLSQNADALSFIGNPYQATVDIQSVLTQNTNFDSNYYWVWDPTINTRGGYVVYDLSLGINPISGSHVNQYLQPWQACFVKNSAIGGGSITFHESNKSNTAAIKGVYKYSSKTNSNSASYIRLTLFESNVLAANGVAADGLVVKFGNNFSNVVDKNDATKFINQDEIFATKNNTSLLGIESRLFPVSSDVIPLNISQYRFTNYTIVANGTNMSGLTAYLQDQFLQTYTEIPQTSSVNYSYVVNASNAATSAPDRFRIVFQNSSLGLETQEDSIFTLYPNPSKGGTFDVITKEATAGTQLAIYNTIGQEVYSTNLIQSNINHINPKRILPAGVYYVRIKKDASTIIKKLIVE